MNSFFSKKGFTGIEVLVVIAVVGMLGTGTVVASDNAKPGDLLYGLDKQVEKIQERLATTQEQKLEFRIKQATERADELEELENELGDSLSDDDTQNFNEAIDQARVALENAESILMALFDSLPASDESGARERLAEVNEMLANLSTAQERHSLLLTRLKQKVNNEEFKQRIEVLENGVLKRIKIEQETDEETGQVHRRIKVYEIDANGNEIKVLDIEEEGDEIQVHDDEDDSSDDDSDDGEDDSEDDSSDDDSDDDESDDDDDNEPTTSPTRSITPEVTGAAKDDSDDDSEAREYDVRWDDGVFEPTTLEINTGDSVEFKNESDAAVSFSSANNQSTSNINTGSLNKGAEYLYTFNSVGTWVFRASGSDAQVTIVVR